jgi:3-oxoacyl-[acyl-carrier protein] reductase
LDLGLRGKRAIVTGATRGIGRAIAERLAEEGCDIGLCARSAGPVGETVAALRGRGVRAFGRALDVADGEALRAFVAAAADDLGGLDVFVANASGAMGGGNVEEAWRAGFDVDIMATVRGCEAALPFLERSGPGAIVLVASGAAGEVVGARRAYNSVKAALLPYAKFLARELAPKNVRCNVVSPGTIWVEGGHWSGIRERDPDRFRSALASNPMGRMGTPEEVANAVAFLASPCASFVSGANLLCDGARSGRVQY